MLKSTSKNPQLLERAVLDFANDMLRKLNKKKRHGRSGWQKKEFHVPPSKYYPSKICARLMERVNWAVNHSSQDPMDYVDVGNFAMFRHWWLKNQNSQEEK